jgi:hypothetical protein
MIPAPTPAITIRSAASTLLSPPGNAHLAHDAPPHRLHPLKEAKGKQAEGRDAEQDVAVRLLLQCAQRTGESRRIARIEAQRGDDQKPAYHDEHRPARDVADYAGGDHQCARSSSQRELLAELRTRRFRHLSNSRNRYADPHQDRRPLPEWLHQQPRGPVTRRPVSIATPHSENHVYGETRGDEIKDAAADQPHATREAASWRSMLEFLGL